MPAKKRFFTKITQVGKKSLKPREKKKPSLVAKTLPKQTKTQQPQKKEDFPKNYRFITEPVGIVRLRPQMLLIVGALVVILAIAGWQFVSVFKTSQKLSQVLKKRAQVEQERQLWENIANKYPNYRDAYFQIALLDYQLGNREEEKVYIQKVLQLDPYFQPAQNLQKLAQ